MIYKKLVTLEFVKSVLKYYPSTGIFLWLKSGPGRKLKPGYVNSNGYLEISLKNRHYPAHRLAWLYMTGKWPLETIDHINNNRMDNSWANLREATKHQQMMNKKMCKNNTTGFKGVSFDRVNKKYRAKIQQHGKTKCLGRYSEAISAAQAYDLAAIEYWGEFAKLNFP
jgi:hypothetical protein